MNHNYIHERYPSLHDQAAVAGLRDDHYLSAKRDWLDELVDRLPMPSSGERFTEEEVFLAQQRVAQEWFGPGVKTDEAIADILTGFGVVTKPLAVAGEYLAKHPVLATAIGALAVAGTGAIFDIDHANAMDHGRANIPALHYGQFTGVDSELGVGHVAKSVPVVQFGLREYGIQSQVFSQLEDLGYDPAISNVVLLDIISDATRVSAEEGRAPRGVSGRIALVSVENGGGLPQFFVVGAEASNGELVAVNSFNEDNLKMTNLELGDDGEWGVVTGKGFFPLLIVDGSRFGEITAQLSLPDGSLVQAFEWTLPGQLASIDNNSVIMASSSEFLDLQTKVARETNNFVLSQDGVIWQKIDDRWEIVPGLRTIVNGDHFVLSIGNEEEVMIAPADVDFDDENGISIDGYDFQDTDGDGMPDSWVATAETVTANFDLGVVLAPGEANEDGSRNIETFAPPEKFADNEGAVAKWLAYFDAERLGFDPDTTEWILTEDGEARLVFVDDHSKSIARWGEIPWLGKAAIVWNAENMVEADGEHPLLDVCENWVLKWKRGTPKELEASVDFVESLRKEAVMAIGGYEMMYGNGENLHAGGENGAIFSNDGKSAVIYLHVKSPFAKDEGFVVTRDFDGNPIILFVENMEWEGY